MTIRAVLDHIDSNLPKSLSRLLELLRIESISTDPAFKDQCIKAADWLVFEGPQIYWLSGRKKENAWAPNGSRSS